MTSLLFKRDISHGYNTHANGYPSHIRCSDGSILRKVLHDTRKRGVLSWKFRNLMNQVAEQAVRENRFDIICLLIGYWYVSLDELLTTACASGRRDMANFILRQHDIREGTMIRGHHIFACCAAKQLYVLKDLLGYCSFEIGPNDMSHGDIYTLWKIFPEGIQLVLAYYEELSNLPNYARQTGNNEFIAFVDEQIIKNHVNVDTDEDDEI